MSFVINELSMTNRTFIYASLTRIADFDTFCEYHPLDNNQWENGDYVLCRVDVIGSSNVLIELPNGRMMQLMEGDNVVGALGVRYATLEATGTFRAVGADKKMHLLTGAGIFGKLTSRSIFITPLIEVTYRGHVMHKGRKYNMRQFRGSGRATELRMPAILFVGTSMSSGKTTSARIVTRLLKQMNVKVTAAKLTGAGRYRDILSLKDAGADFIYDFVDGGLPSSVCESDEFKPALEYMLDRINESESDVAVVEIGASPLEPYNGAMAIEAIKDQIACTILCASDPYAVLGVMHGFDLKPTLVSGPAVNTLAGIDLIKKLCGVPALNFLMQENRAELSQIIARSLDITPPDIE